MMVQKPDFSYLNLGDNIQYQLSVPELMEQALLKGEGTLTDSGALAVNTGRFTGRSPKDRFIVCDEITEQKVWWGEVNIKFDPIAFDLLYEKVIRYLHGKSIFIRDALACADAESSIGIRVVTETAYQNLFVHHLLIRPDIDEVLDPEWTVIAAPGFLADPAKDETRQENFSIINFSRKMILIGGTGYTGEIKKGIFSVLNFILPVEKQILPMHCSANVGVEGDTAIFFGLSGTGKTTLSADPERALIGDDEHGWTDDAVFNFEGGCYAKCVDLSEEKEPQIYHAIRFGALLENTNYFEGTRRVDFSDVSTTENTRVAYPLNYISGALEPSKAKAPKNIFFLTADAFGVLPPISKLDIQQAMFYFINGYTAKVAGTETGINTPQLTFSSCFGKAFLPLHPFAYADLLAEKMSRQDVNVWLVNTGWTGGAYGIGRRMDLRHTRAMVRAALNGSLIKSNYTQHPIFKLMIPDTCPGVPPEILNPVLTWKNEAEYNLKAMELSEALSDNFKLFDPESTTKEPVGSVKMC